MEISCQQKIIISQKFQKIINLIMRQFFALKSLKFHIWQLKNFRADFENQKIKDTQKPRYYQKGEKEIYEKKYYEHRLANEDFWVEFFDLDKKPSEVT